jgi:hypothetical protein
MKTRTLSRTEWHPFFRDLSRIHMGALVTLNVSGLGIGSHDEVVDQPFRGISEDGDEVFVHVGNGNEHPHLERRMQHVDAIHVQQTDEGADAAVNISTIDGTQTSLRFRSPALPELLDPAVE